MFPAASTAGLATGCTLSASRAATAKGTALLCRSPWTTWTLAGSVRSGTTPSNNVGVTSTGRVGLVPKTILQVSNAWVSKPVQDTATCPPRRPACGITWCNVIGCIAMQDAYDHHNNKQRSPLRRDNTMESLARTAFLASVESGGRSVSCPTERPCGGQRHSPVGRDPRTNG